MEGLTPKLLFSYVGEFLNFYLGGGYLLSGGADTGILYICCLAVFQELI